MKLKYFSPETDPVLFRCSCGRPDCDAPAPSPLLLGMLDVMREMYGHALTVTSGPRCRRYNAEQRGVPESEHLYGDGADLACRSSSERWDMIRAALASGFRRLGVGATFVHVGVSDREAHAQDVMWTYYARGTG